MQVRYITQRNLVHEGTPFFVGQGFVNDQREQFVLRDIQTSTATGKTHLVLEEIDNTGRGPLMLREPSDMVRDLRCGAWVAGFAETRWGGRFA